MTIMIKTLRRYCTLTILAALCAVPAAAPAQIDRTPPQQRGAATGTAADWWQRGSAALATRRPDYRRAMQCFLESARRGGKPALLDIGVMHVNGEGVARNLIEGYAWYHVAAKAGVQKAANYMQDLQRSLNQRQVMQARNRSREIEAQLRGTARKPRGLLGNRKSMAQVGAAIGSSTVGKPKGSGNTLKLRKHVVRDPQAGNLEAFSILVPSGWSFRGKVHWNHNYANLATALVESKSPNGTTFEILPLIPFTWWRGGIPYFPEGKVYMGFEVRPVTLDTVQFVRRFVQPRCLDGRRTARIVGRKDMPQIANMIRQRNGGGNGFRATAGSVRLEYDENGRTMHEDIYMVLTATVNPFMPRAVTWQPTSLFSLKAEKGRLDSHRDLAVVIAMSTHITRKWYQAYYQVQQIRLNGIRRGISDARRLSQQIARNGEEIRKMTHDSYVKAQASQDRMADSFSRYLRGVERYDDPMSETSVSLPSGYDQAWVSGTGEYILSNDAMFDPNVQSTQNWQQMRTTPLGQ